MLIAVFSCRGHAQGSDVRTVLDTLIQMHHKENKFATGMNTAILQLRKVTFDVQFDANRFRP